jgi:6,7-dimethyl-8-ribityllumazine synthase
MARIHKGTTDASGLRFGIVVSRFNQTVTERLLDGALKALREHGAGDDDIVVAHVPGAFEIPLLASSLAESGAYDAVICLGAVVRGETQHHHYINTATFDALQNIAVRHRLPVALGILTTETMEQALRRSGDDRGNKGFDAATTAVEVATLLRALGPEAP